MCVISSEISALHILSAAPCPRAAYNSLKLSKKPINKADKTKRELVIIVITYQVILQPRDNLNNEPLDYHHLTIIIIKKL